MTVWYLRSFRDEDTHCGRLAGDGTVTAVCGVRFAPLGYPFDHTVGLPGKPPDPLQICPGCRTGAQ